MASKLSAPPRTHALLADGTTVSIRPALSDDRARVLRLYQDLSPESLRLRFSTAGLRSARQAAAKACSPARVGYLALVAETGGRVVGIAEYDTAVDSSPEPTCAENALVVADDWHDRGVGTLLVEHLVGAARVAGIRRFTADALAENGVVLQVFNDLGLSASRRLEGTEIHCTLQLEQREGYLAVVEARGRVADVAGMRPLLCPTSIAVVGAGRWTGSAGWAVLDNLQADGFTGSLYAVAPQTDWIGNIPCHPAVEALPGVPDLAVLAVPASAVPEVAEQCGRNGIRAVVVVASGLDAAEANARLAVRAYGMQLVGPSCLGIANADPAVRMDATFAARRPLPDGLSRLGIGASTSVSLGDAYDICGNDLLQWWETDGRITLALLYLESFQSPRAFSRITQRVARAMPVLTVDVGRFEAGRLRPPSQPCPPRNCPRVDASRPPAHGSTSRDARPKTMAPKKDIFRCLKRFIAREVYKYLTSTNIPQKQLPRATCRKAGQR
ncbi:GNAT family N-acetyltransferase [Streptomyces sp. S.PB5]|uniref:GNAT family N-acetyltransferase n=1 Tax=Streptomyces sp. S.PB5 TaxID=3020844 RepID=UPI00339D60F1